jgi:hypothetical protein
MGKPNSIQSDETIANPHKTIRPDPASSPFNPPNWLYELVITVTINGTKRKRKAPPRFMDPPRIATVVLSVGPRTTYGKAANTGSTALYRHFKSAKSSNKPIVLPKRTEVAIDRAALPRRSKKTSINQKQTHARA